MEKLLEIVREKYGDNFKGGTVGDLGARFIIGDFSVELDKNEINQPIENVIELIDERLK